MLEDRPLLVARDGPAGGIVRRVEVERPRARLQCLQQLFDDRASSPRREIAAPRSSTVAPRIFGISCRFGQSGTTSTTRSPGSMRSCEASISAFTPALVTATWSARSGGAAASGTRRAPPAAPGCRGCACRRARPRAIESVPALRMNSGVGSSGSPTQKASMSLPADAFVVELADLRGGERAHRGARGQRGFRISCAAILECALAKGDQNVRTRPRRSRRQQGNRASDFGARAGSRIL